MSPAARAWPEEAPGHMAAGELAPEAGRAPRGAQPFGRPSPPWEGPVRRAGAAGGHEGREGAAPAHGRVETSATKTRGIC